MEIIENNKHLGELKINTPYSFSTDLFNNSEGVINITAISPLCGSCTVARVDKTIVEPKETIKLIYTFTPNSTGYNSKRININYSGNNVNEIITFNFSAEVTN